MEIPFIQYLLPNGRKTNVSIERPDDIGLKAKSIIERGYRFECECLTTGDVSFTITDKDGDADIEICPNGPGVPAAVDRLVRRFSKATETSHD